MSASDSIKHEIITKISALSSVHVCYGTEKLNPKGFPAVFVTLQGIDGEFSSTAENRRIYSYRAFAMYPIGPSIDTATEEALAKAERVLAQVLEDIINTIDSDFELNDNSQVLFTEAADSDFGYIEYEGGWAKSAQITLRVQNDYLV